MGELEASRDGEEPEDGEDQAPDQVGGEHDPAPVHLVAAGPAEQQEQHLRGGDGHADQAERAGVVGEPVDLPGEGDEEDAVAEEGDGHAAHEQGEVAQPQGRAQADPGPLPGGCGGRGQRCADGQRGLRSDRPAAVSRGLTPTPVGRGTPFLSPDLSDDRGRKLALRARCS
jgi:hypothetical protein